MAFPGGRVEKDESDLEASIRETSEEVGIDLRKGTPTPTLAPKEVASIHWTHIDTFLPPTLFEPASEKMWSPIVYPVFFLTAPTRRKRGKLNLWLRRTLQPVAETVMGKVEFYGVVMPEGSAEDDEVVLEELGGGHDRFSISESSRRVLWGLTLWMTSDLVDMMHGGVVGIAPRSLMQVKDDEMKDGKVAVAVYDCQADDAQELSFRKGDIIVDIIDAESEGEGWLKGRLEGTDAVGLFPDNYVRILTEEYMGSQKTAAPALPFRAPSSPSMSTQRSVSDGSAYPRPLTAYDHHSYRPVQKMDAKDMAAAKRQALLEKSNALARTAREKASGHLRESSATSSNGPSRRISSSSSSNSISSLDQGEESGGGGVAGKWPPVALPGMKRSPSGNSTDSFSSGPGLKPSDLKARGVSPNPPANSHWTGDGVPAAYTLKPVDVIPNLPPSPPTPLRGSVVKGPAIKKGNPFLAEDSKDGLPPRPMTHAHGGDRSVIPADSLKLYDEIFDAADENGDGLVSGDEVRRLWIRSGLDKDSLAKIWSDTKKQPYLHASADRSDQDSTSASESEANTSPTKLPRLHQPHHRHIPGSVTSNVANGYDSTGGNSSSASGTSGRKRGPRRGQFKPRSSPLDYEALQREQSPIRGFLVLFWMAMAWYMVTTFYHNFRLEGAPVRLRFLYYISHDGLVLALSDAVLVASCFLVVPLQWAVLWGLPLRQAYAVQHIWQAVWFGAVIGWVFYRDWPWLYSPESHIIGMIYFFHKVQGGFFCLHGISMLMKQHSYTAANLELHYKHSILVNHNKEVGALKRLRDEVNVDHEVQKANEEKIHAILEEMEVLKLDLNKKTVAFPNNLTILNFVDYMLVPTLVYELEYPRTSKFRPSYFFEKAVATAGTFFLLYVTVEHYIIPTLAISQQIDFVTSVMNLIIPFMVCYLLIFFIIFECICNAFAELTRFADREFYEDWWNSSSFDEYARKWNKPVHEFLLRHVYGDTIANLKFSKTNATFLTFFLSSCFHEIVFVVTAKRIRMYMFMLQMLQIPLIYIARIP
ncbi:hypothetical protein HDU67_008768, partial [Dinochytrium kinnereticum]